MSFRSYLPVLLLACLAGPSLAEAEEPLRVSVCQVLEDPATYNQKVIEISGLVSRGFEDFTLRDEKCKNPNMIWLELGGNKGSQVMYCCGVPTDPDRPKPLVVEGIETKLIEDANFKEFQKLTMPRRGYGQARVTLVGRYFSGEKQTFPGGTFWVGYGHMGMATLLVIEQVTEAHSK